MPRKRWLAAVVAVVAVGGLIGKLAMDDSTTAPRGAGLPALIPLPASVTATPDTAVTLGPDAVIVVDPQAKAVGDYLADLLRPATGYAFPVTDDPAGKAGIVLTVRGSGTDESYELRTDGRTVTVAGASPVGLFRGVQTLRQLLPAAVERREAQAGPWTVPGVTIADRPRFAYRGAMLDVARHFFGVAEVLRYIDHLALYKVNYLHLHLTDDQGWRLEITTWPRLTTVGAATSVGGGPGGFYTHADYKKIVEYAAARFITVVPEIDLPGHTNAALSAYPELTADGQPVAPYTGIEVGFSSLVADNPRTYRFLEDVFAEVAALTPGPWVHLGGDEAKSTSREEYDTMLTRAQQIVRDQGKTPIGWHEVAEGPLDPATVVQFWGTTGQAPDVVAAAKAGNKVIMSPANRAYIDQQYSAGNRLGLHWAAYIEVDDAYNWDPATYLPGVGEDDVFGIEAPLWTETAVTGADLDELAFPRLPELAEIGWSPAATHDWDAMRDRLAGQASRWEALGINFYRSPRVDWPAAGS